MCRLTHRFQKYLVLVGENIEERTETAFAVQTIHLRIAATGATDNTKFLIL